MDDIFAKKDIIYTIYEQRSFSKAAQKLFIAQPSLSLIVRKLEDDLGVPLFDRTTKPIGITEAGMEYIRAVEQLKNVEDSFKNYIRKVNRMEAGTLDIGSNQLLSSLHLPKYIDQFIQQYPGITLTINDANSTSLAHELSVGNLDLVIDNHVLSPELFQQQELGREHLLLAVPKHYAENQNATDYQLTYEDILAGKHRKCEHAVPLKLFSTVPFILMNRNNDTRKQTDAIFQQEQFDPTVLFEMDRLATIYTYIGLGTAASIVSDTLIRGLPYRDHSAIVYYPLPGPHARRSLYLSYRRNRHRSLAAVRFAELLQKQFFKD